MHVEDDHVRDACERLVQLLHGDEDVSKEGWAEGEEEDDDDKLVPVP